jgi:hypothetical protein
MSPHTLLEAGLMKKPILATNVGGTLCLSGVVCGVALCGVVGSGRALSACVF